jgi:hypothetical protein
MKGLRADLGTVPEFAARDREENYKSTTRRFPCWHSEQASSLSEVLSFTTAVAWGISANLHSAVAWGISANLHSAVAWGISANLHSWCSRTERWIF